MKPPRLLSHLLPVIAITASTLVSASAQDPIPPPKLEPKLAVKLMAQAYDVPEGEIRISYILGGEKDLQAGFRTKHAAAVSFIRTVVEDGFRRRRCAKQIFLHTPEFGWFLEEIETEEARDVLRIWSEKQGFLVFN